MLSGLLRKPKVVVEHHVGDKHDTSTDERLSYNERIESLRQVQYPMLRGITYLDHAGTTLPSKSLITAFSEQMQSQLLGNPHSSSPSSPSVSHQIVEGTRRKVLELFGANPEHFDVVFVANATAGIKLVVEAFTGHDDGFEYYYHRDSHTSLVGVRELAVRSRCFVSDEEVETWMTEKDEAVEGEVERVKLFAYPAQSNMNGRRLPLSWPSLLRCTDNKPRTYTLLDVAALVSTSPLELRNHTTAPDFLVMSFYKIFGFPNIGALIIRKSAAHLFDRKRYFGGGTTGMVTVSTKPWMVRKETSLSDRLEDGTGATHSILALSCAIDAHKKLFGGLEGVSKHTTWLAKRLYDGLEQLRHANGTRVCDIYKDRNSTYGESRTQGATVAFNVRNSDGTWVGSTAVGKIALQRRIHIRAGGMCNPGGTTHALGFSDEDIQTAWYAGFRCGQEDDLRKGRVLGMVRVSLGAMSTVKDVDEFLRFMEECFVEAKATSEVAWTVGTEKEKEHDDGEEQVTAGLPGQRIVVPVQKPGRLQRLRHFVLCQRSSE